MHLESSGFTPGSTYQFTVSDPDGRQYKYLLDGGQGRADDTGRASHWRWNCYISPNDHDRPGVYHLHIQDLTTHRAADVDFTVSYDN
jgi:hypothetical protein